jgi:hypothetical protein
MKVLHRKEQIKDQTVKFDGSPCKLVHHFSPMAPQHQQQLRESWEGEKMYWKGTKDSEINEKNYPP